jgi:hypothetical protein
MQCMGDCLGHYGTCMVYLLHKQDCGQYLLDRQEMMDVGLGVMGTRVAGTATQKRCKITRIPNSINTMS